MYTNDNNVVTGRDIEEADHKCLDFIGVGCFLVVVVFFFFVVDYYYLKTKYLDLCNFLRHFNASWKLRFNYQAISDLLTVGTYVLCFYYLK